MASVSGFLRHEGRRHEPSPLLAVAAQPCWAPRAAKAAHDSVSPRLSTSTVAPFARAANRLPPHPATGSHPPHSRTAIDDEKPLGRPVRADRHLDKLPAPRATPHIGRPLPILVEPPINPARGEIHTQKRARLLLRLCRGRFHDDRGPLHIGVSAEKMSPPAIAVTTAPPHFVATATGSATPTALPLGFRHRVERQHESPPSPPLSLRPWRKTVPRLPLRRPPSGSRRPCRKNLPRP